MGIRITDDAVARRIRLFVDREQRTKEQDLYFYNQPVEAVRDGAHVTVGGRLMGLFASYNYLGLIGHPRITTAAKAAVDQFGTGTHGVRLLAGSLVIHTELEETIAAFKHAEAAITYSSGYVTNVTVISTLVGRVDYVISDKLNHASIVDGCLMSGAEFRRFQHNDMQELERRLQQVPAGAARLVVADAVFSMDGDVLNLPRTVDLCRKYKAWLMVDEAHSLGVLGRTGTGIEEHFGLGDVIDIKMGTLSKIIPSVGGFVAGRKDLVRYLRHASRAYIFFAAIPPAQVAAANEAFKVILDEPWRVEKVNANAAQLTRGLKSAGFDTLATTTAIVPVVCGADNRAYQLTRECQHKDLFVLPVVSPAVPEGLARLRVTVTAAHEPVEIERALVIIQAEGKKLGIVA